MGNMKRILFFFVILCLVLLGVSSYSNNNPTEATTPLPSGQIPFIDTDGNLRTPGNISNDGLNSAPPSFINKVMGDNTFFNDFTGANDGYAGTISDGPPYDDEGTRLYQAYDIETPTNPSFSIIFPVPLSDPYSYVTLGSGSANNSGFGVNAAALVSLTNSSVNKSNWGIVYRIRTSNVSGGASFWGMAAVNAFLDGTGQPDSLVGGWGIHEVAGELSCLVAAPVLADTSVSMDHTLVANEWTEVIVTGTDWTSNNGTVTGGTVRCYVNGELKATIPFSDFNNAPFINMQPRMKMETVRISGTHNFNVDIHGAWSTRF